VVFSVVCKFYKEYHLVVAALGYITLLMIQKT